MWNWDFWKINDLVRFYKDFYFIANFDLNLIKFICNLIKFIICVL